MCVQREPELGSVLLGTGDLSELRGTCTVLKPARKDAFLDRVLVVAKM